MRPTRRGIATLLLSTVGLVALRPAVARAQDTTGAGLGTWQGTLGATAGPTAPPLRLVLQLAREADGRLTAASFSLDQAGWGAPTVALAATLDGAQENAPYVIPDVQRRLALIFDRWAPISFAERATLIRELADTTLPVLQRDLRSWARELAAAPNATVRPTGLRRDPVASALFAGAQRYTKVNGPVLAIYAAPRPLPPNAPGDSAARARLDSVALAAVLPQITAFQRGVPQARVVRLAHASHYVFQSNAADVLREIDAFIEALPPRR